MRLDLYLVEKGYFSTRSKAKLAIDENKVFVNGQNKKASYEVLDLDKIEVVNPNPYVSRGGYKLEGAIKEFKLDFNNKIIVDIGSSTGGFTDCALQHGAKLVYSIDVGTNQMDEKLKEDKRIVLMENTNIKDIESFDNPIDFLVMDVSFVSIEYLLPYIYKHINDNNALVALIKPQFEVGNIKIKGGIVKSRTSHIKVIENVINELAKYNLSIYKLVKSPILGGDGNTEYLALIKKGINKNINILEVV